MDFNANDAPTKPAEQINAELLNALQAIIPILDRAFEYDGDVFGIMHNAAVDAGIQARAAIAKAEAALAEPQADADGWIPWSGGGCPIPKGMAFDLQFRDGAKLIAASGYWPAAEWDWSCDSSPYGIVAYRIAKKSDK